MSRAAQLHRTALQPSTDNLFVYPFDYDLPRNLPQCALPYLTFPTIKNKNYNVKLDLTNFDPAEISIKVEDSSIKVSGKREKKTADGKQYEYRQYEQYFTLPDNVNVKQLKAQLDQKGILLIEAPVLGELEDQMHHIPVEFAKK